MLQILSDISGSKELIPTTVEFVDIAGLVKGASKGEGMGNQFLTNIRDTNAVCQVIRLGGVCQVMRLGGVCQVIRLGGVCQVMRLGGAYNGEAFVDTRAAFETLRFIVNLGLCFLIGCALL